MNFAPTASSSGLSTNLSLPLLLGLLLLLPACAGKVIKETEAEPVHKPKEVHRAQMDLPTWLGNPARNFYGSGPWTSEPLQVVWDFKTQWSSGRLHEDPWGGSGWPGQPALVGERVYFGSADSRVYCLNAKDGSLVWSYLTTDSAKSSPAVSGNYLVIGNLDHAVYCLNTSDGTLFWKYQTGFETDSSPAIVDDRVYIGGEDHFYYCLDLKTGALIYKQQMGGSVEWGTTIVDGKIYVDTEAGDLYCLNMQDGTVVWK